MTWALPLYQALFPSVGFLMRVLHKLRGMDNIKLNGRLERVLVAITRVMTVAEFAEILPFDPREATLASERQPNSYTLNTLRCAPLTTLCPTLSRKYSLLFNSRANPCGRPSRPNSRPNARYGRRFFISTGASLGGFINSPPSSPRTLFAICLNHS
ncbi:unnamed protein product [Phytomonas sp. Hart1]|nr:unnamed protein product [Phytomonas sp. Hart1]|eukprot:CCW69660.1 unnamed protein product [Phytomonas sp. isolate Hart1]